MGYIPHKKTIAHGIVFDSADEAAYFVHLKDDPNVKDITIKPQFTLLEPFKVICGKCKGEGKKPSPKTGKAIKCRTCDGTGKRGRQPWKYTADFQVYYKDGTSEVVDVKGHANERFPLVKKMFEFLSREELIVVKRKGKEWVKK